MPREEVEIWLPTLDSSKGSFFGPNSELCNHKALDQEPTRAEPDCYLASRSRTASIVTTILSHEKIRIYIPIAS